MDNPLFWTLFEPGISLLENILLVSFVVSCLGSNTESRARKMLGVTGTVLVGFLFSFVENTPPISSVEFLITIIILFLYALFFLNGSVLRKAIVCVVARVLTMLSNSLVIFLLSVIFRVDGGIVFAEQDSARVITVLLTKVIYFFLSRLVASFFQRKGNLLPWQWLSIGAGFLMSNFSGTMAIALTREVPMGNQTARIQMLVIVCMIWLICLLFYFTVVRMMRDNDLRTENELLRQNKEHQVSQIQQIQDSNERVSAIKHDLKNYVGLVERLLRQGKTEEALAKCEEVTGLIDSVQVQLKTGSDSIDAVLNEKISLSKQKGIDTKCSVFCDTAKLPVLAFCSVFGNLMDNAMEAEMKLPQERRRITVELFSRYGMSYLRISNAITGSVLDSNPKLETTKHEERTQHGLGHKSAERTLHDLGGTIHYREKDGNFIAEAVFPE